MIFIKRTCRDSTKNCAQTEGKLIEFPANPWRVYKVIQNLHGEFAHKSNINLTQLLTQHSIASLSNKKQHATESS